MKVAGLQPSINMILPYATPRLSGCSREALVEFSACCIENSRDLFQVLEAEYRKMYAKNLTLSRLSEAVILPLCPDKGSCIRSQCIMEKECYRSFFHDLLLREWF